MAKKEKKVKNHIDNWSMYGVKMCSVDLHMIEVGDRVEYQPSITYILDEFDGVDDPDPDKMKSITLLVEKKFKSVDEGILYTVNVALGVTKNVLNAANIFGLNHEVIKRINVDTIKKKDIKKSKSGVSFY